MNQRRRKLIEEAVQKIEEAKTLLEIVRDEESEAFDNMPENLQSSDRGEKMETAISSMEDAIADIENVVDTLASVTE